jgi:hypothetical protein
MGPPNLGKPMIQNKEKSGPFGGLTCKHVKLDGTACAQPARRGKDYCRFHHIMYEPVVMPGQPLYRPPILEDTGSVQVVIMQVIRELMRQPIDKHNAGLILYGLQLASSNLSRFRELYPPPPPPEEEDDSRPSLASELLAALREDLAKASEPEPIQELPIPTPLTNG